MAITRRVAKALILDNGGNFLLLRRTADHPFLPGFYDLPGGTIDKGEEPGDAVVREVFEETSLRVDKADIELLYTTTKLLHGGSYPTMLYLIRLSHEKPEMEISWEHQSYEWAPLERLPEAEPQFAQTYREALEYILLNTIIEDIDKVHANS